MKNLEPHQYRVLNERAELRDKLEKLLAFINSPAFSNVELAEQKRLRHQVDCMGEYLNILNERVAAIDA